MSDELRAALQSVLADRYRLDRELGRGGMATVFLVQDLRHDRPVALKVLHPALAAALGPERFQREIRLAARLQHPHILTVLDSGAAGRTGSGADVLWFTMPFVEGESLRDRLLRERQMPVEVALRIAREAADALDYAHRHGVIHRDIKPENILLSDGHALVADFGISKALGSGAEEDPRLTETGMALGTPAYMSPEQAAGERSLDARTDVYSLGSVLYEMLAGEAPYTGPTAQAIMARRLTEPVPSLRRLRPNLPEAVDRAVQRALAPVPADRFSSAAQLAQALQGTASYGTDQTTIATPSIEARASARRGVPVAAAALVLGILIGLGVLFAWRRSHMGATGTAGTRVLAVLPFENLGDSADAYFADGVTDEVRTKLAQVEGLDVIARASSNEYRGTSKRAQEIAQELGAGYLLSGTVRWTKTAEGASRVRVTPELVEVVPGRAPRTRWGEQFDAGLTDVFEVQGEIAGKVVSALDVALADSAREELVAKPTGSVEAYDAFLKGEAVSVVSSFGSQRRGIGFYQEAVRLDPNFALAWANLARTAAGLHVNTGDVQAIEIARKAAERARQLAPERPQTYAALAAVHASTRDDPAGALAIVEAGLNVAPNNADLLVAAALQEQTLGRFESVVGRMERAFAIDPRSAVISRRLGYALMVLRRYPEAKTAFERGLTLAPSNLAIQQNMALLALMQGDVESVRRIGDHPPGNVSRDAVLAYLAHFEELGWAMDRRQQDRVLELGPELFEDERSSWAIVRANLHLLRGDRAGMRAWGDTARRAYEEALRQAPDDPQQLVVSGVALAYAGRYEEAIRAGERAVELSPPTKDLYFGPYIQHQLVRIHLLAGRQERALDLLEPLLAMPYTLTPAWLRIDPMFDPLRKHPRFQRLIATP